MRVMITGGGTGGHTSPAVAIIEELQKRDPRLELQWVGRRGGVEERVSKNLSIPFRSVPVEGWPRKRSLRRAWVAAKLGLGVARSFLHLRHFRPQLVLGVGGYVSLPLGIAAQRSGVPVVLHEQNKRLGMANQMLAARAARVFLSYPDTIGNYPEERAKVVGNPVRAGFSSPPDPFEARSTLGLDPGIPVVLVCGGSQGAHSLNNALLDALVAFSEDEVQIVWMTGAKDAGKARAATETADARVQVFPFIDDMPAACAAADLIVTRAGASTTAEIATLGKPSIMVPFPFATDNHQEQNARAFEAVGASLVLLDGECTGERLAAEMRGLLAAPQRLAAMGLAAETLTRRGAAEAIVEDLLVLAFEKPEN